MISEKVLKDKKGAVVIIDPRNGDILAMASSPTFDPNIFVVPRTEEEVEQIKELYRDKNLPLRNRVINNQYPLGSAFKVVVALAALELNDSRRITKETIYTCNGSFRLGRSGQLWRCYRSYSHGRMNVISAIKKSCNVFFYNVGRRIGRDSIVAMASKFRLGERTGIPLTGEQKGVNPTKEWQRSDDWRAREYRIWYPGYTINLAIGQYPFEVTPLQVACLYAAIANGGTLYKPRLISKIVQENNVIEPPVQNRKVDVNEENLNIVQKALVEVTRPGGTAASAFAGLEHLKVAGKTSTAQYGKHYEKSYAWFIGYAPYDNPEILAVVLVEEGATGGKTAAPLARDILKHYFEHKKETRLSI